jgi:cyclic beta-1,2-glucan synthetase
MQRVILESVLGLTLSGGDTLVVRPCIPSSWSSFEARLVLPGGVRLHVHVANGEPGTVHHATLDGAPVPVADGAARLPLTPGAHTAEIALG